MIELFDQTTFSDVNAGTHGDCFRATVCTVLQVNPETLPHPIAPDGGWNRAFHKALREMGWMARTIDFDCDNDPAASDPDLHVIYPRFFRIPRVVLAAGMSPRGVRHSVVWDRIAGRMIHDPHPSRAGLDYIEAFDFLMPIPTDTPTT